MAPGHPYPEGFRARAAHSKFPAGSLLLSSLPQLQ